jgi:hypothetical protein
VQTPLLRNKLAPVKEKLPEIPRTPQGNLKKNFTPFYSAKISKPTSSSVKSQKFVSSTSIKKKFDKIVKAPSSVQSSVRKNLADADKQSSVQLKSATRLQPIKQEPEKEVQEEPKVIFKTNFEIDNGCKYTGEMIANQDKKNSKKPFLQNGKGTQEFPDGSKYDGQWRNGKQYGEGTFTHANGDVFKGHFKDDKCEGYGVLQHANDGQKYEGQWKNNK